MKKMTDKSEPVSGVDQIRADINSLFSNLEELLRGGKMPSPEDVVKAQVSLRGRLVRAYDSLTPEQRRELIDKLDQVDKCYENVSTLYVSKLCGAFREERA